MKLKYIQFIIPALILCLYSQTAVSQSMVLPDNYPVYNISVSNSPDEGYLFLTSCPTGKLFPGYMMILDNYGTPVYYRYMTKRAGDLMLQRNGLLSFKNVVVGRNLKHYIMDSSFVVIDSVWMNDYILDGHDFTVLESGNFLMFGKNARNLDMTAYGGVEEATVIGCIIRELDRDRNTVFEWNTWDHFEITDSYNDLTKSSVDLIHPNSLDADQDGNILLISRGLNEVTKINRENGDIIWRLGGKNNQFAFMDSSQMFSMPHDFRPLENGHYTIFDNGNNRTLPYSRAVEYVIGEEKMTIEMVWEYDADMKVFGPTNGSTRRLPSGNTIIGYGGKSSSPAIIEVHPDGSKALQLDFSDDLSTAKVFKFPWRTNLFTPNTYAVNFGEWDGYTTGLYRLIIRNNASYPVSLTSYSTRTGAFGVKTDFPIHMQPKDQDTLWLTYFPVNINTGYVEDVLTINSDINSDTLVQRIAQQIKLYGSKVDHDKPEALISLASAKDVPQDTTIWIRINEPVRKADGFDLNYLNVDSLIVLKMDGPEGEAVHFDAVISTDKKLITITTDTLLNLNQTYFIAISDSWEDYSGNRGSSVATTFETVGSGSPSGNRSPFSGTMNADLVKVFPNPGTGLFLLEFRDNAERCITVFDHCGREVYLKGNVRSDTYSLDLRTQPPAIYFIRIEEVATGCVSSLKLLKQ